MTNKTISITIPSDDAIALHELGAAMQRMAGRHGLEVQQYVVERETHTCGDLSHTIERVLVDTDKAQLAALGEAVEIVKAAAPALMDDKFKCDGEEVSGPRADTTTTNSPQIDSDGMPWDVRIHSDNKTLNPNGTWRSRKKPADMDDQAWRGLKSGVTDELMRMRKSPVVVEPIEPEPIIVNEVSADSYVEFIRWVTACEFSSEKVDDALSDVGLADIKQLNGNPGAIIKVREILTFS